MSRTKSPITVIAGEALEAYRRVKLVAGTANTVVHADAADRDNWIGVTVQEVAIGLGVGIWLKDAGMTLMIEASEAIAAYNGLIYAADDGKIADTANGASIGRNLELASASGSIIECLLGSDTLGLGAAGSYIDVSKDGHDTNGNGTPLNPYLTLTQALSVVTNGRKIIRLQPGEYAGLPLTWPSISGVQLLAIGGHQWATIISSATGDQVISMAPTLGSTFEAWIDGIQIDHDVSGQDGILIDNQNMTAKMLVYLNNFGANGDSADKGIITSHDYGSEAIRVYMDGNNGAIDSDIFFDVGNNGDRFYATGTKLSGGVESSADAIVAAFQFINCWGLPEDAALTGGNAAQTILSQNSYSDAPAAIDTSDLAGSHTETIV